MVTALAIVVLVAGAGAFAAGVVVALRADGPTTAVTTVERLHVPSLPEGLTWRSVGAGVVGVGVGLLVWFVAGLGDAIGLASTVALGAVGLLGPKALEDRREARRLQRIDDAVADVAGLLSVELRAGLGVDASIENVAHELEGPLPEELRVLTAQVRLGLPRAEALALLRERAATPNVERFVQTISHAEELGAPVAHTLEQLADDCTTRRQQHLREEAAKLPVKILFPVLFCIFPPMLVILAGPALADILKAF